MLNHNELYSNLITSKLQAKYSNERTDSLVA